MAANQGIGGGAPAEDVYMSEDSELQRVLEMSKNVK